MVLGFLAGSTTNLALMKVWPPIVTCVTPSLQTRFIVLTCWSGIAAPSVSADTNVHSPSSFAISFLTASLASSAAIKKRDTNTAVIMRMRTSAQNVKVRSNLGVIILRSAPWQRLAIFAIGGRDVYVERLERPAAGVANFVRFSALD